MSAAPIFEPISKAILTPIQQWAGVSNTLVTWVAPLVLLGLTISIMWHGFNLMRGAGGHHHTLDVFVHSLRAFLVVSLALVGGAYDQNVVGFMNDLRTDLANLFSSTAPGTNSYQVLDESVGKAVDAMRAMMPWVADNTNILTGNFTGLIGLASMAFMVGCMVVYAMIAAVNLLLVDFSLAVIYAVGPLFVACFAFQATARFFDGWLGGAFKYTFTAIVTTAVLGIGNGILQRFATGIAANTGTMDFIGAGFSALGASGVLIMIAARVPEIAGNIVGGIGVAVLGPAASKAPLASMSNAVKSTARGSANAAAYGAGAVANMPAAKQIMAGATQDWGAVSRGISESSVGEKYMALQQSAGRFASATLNMGSGSVGAAFRTGSGSDIGTGVVTGSRGVDMMSGIPKAPAPLNWPTVPTK